MNMNQLQTKGGTFKKAENGVNDLFAINANYKLFIYGVWVSIPDRRNPDKTIWRFKHGEHIDNNEEGVIKYIVKKYFTSKANEFDKERDLIGIIDMTDHAISLNPLFDPRLERSKDVNRKGHYDKELIPGLEEVGFKHIKGDKAKSEFGRSFELFEPPKDMSDEEVKHRFNTYHENLKKPTLDICERVVYDARDFVEDSKTKIEETYINEVLEDRHLVAGAPGTGKETGGLALIQIVHDLYRFDDTTINIFSCTIPKNLAEPISELARVDGYRFKDETIADFSRFKCYMTNSLYKGLKPELEGDVQSWVRDNVQFIESADEIPNKHSKGIIPLLFAGYQDIAYKGTKAIREKYIGLVGRVSTFALNEAHQFLKLENKMYTSLSSNLGWKFFMPLTGTPYPLIFGEPGLLTFNKDQRSIMSRQQMMIDKKNNPESPYAKYPDILTYGPSLLDEVKEKMSQDSRWKSDADGMTMQGLVANYDPKTKIFKYFDFIHRLCFRLFAKDDFGDHDGLSIHNLPDLCAEAKNNLICFLPQGFIKGVGVKVYIPALVKQLEASGALGVYKPYVSYTDDLSDIKDDAKNPSIKTIVFTHRKHATGTNVPDWGTSIMMMPVGNSLTFYEQGPEGRVSRASDNKTNCGLVLLEPDNSMSLKVQIEEKLSIERNENKTFSQIIDEVHDCYPYYNDINGELVRVSREDYAKILEEMSKRGSYSLTMCCNRTNIGGINEFFSDVDSSESTDVDITNNNNKKAKTKSSKQGKQFELDFGDVSEDEKEKNFHNMKKQMIARLKKLLIIHNDEINPTIEDCYNFLNKAKKGLYSGTIVLGNSKQSDNQNVAVWNNGAILNDINPVKHKWSKWVSNELLDDADIVRVHFNSPKDVKIISKSELAQQMGIDKLSCYQIGYRYYKDTNIGDVLYISFDAHEENWTEAINIGFCDRHTQIHLNDVHKIMGKTINYIDLLDNDNSPTHFDVNYTNRWLGKINEVKNIEDALEFLRDKELFDNEKQFIPEKKDLMHQIVKEVLKESNLNNNSFIIDQCGGRGGFLIHLILEAKKLDIDINMKRVYYNDIDPVSVSIFKALNRDYKLGIPEKNITCKDALQLEYDMKFNLSISNVAYNSREETYTGSVSVSGGNMGTVGDKGLGKKLNKKQREITETGGTVVQMGLKGSMFDEATNDPNFNPELVSLMADRDWWKYNTFYVIGKIEPNTYSYKLYTGDTNSDIVSKIFKKKDFNFTIQQNSYNQLKDNGFITEQDTGNPLCIVRNKKKEDMSIIRAYPTDKGQKKVINGPKFIHYMAESSVTWLATDEPVLCDCSVVFPTDTLEDAEKMYLFTKNNPLLKFTWKILKLKGQDQFWQFCKKFDLNQIITGYEYPVEYNLTKEEIDYLNENFKRN